MGDSWNRLSQEEKEKQLQMNEDKTNQTCGQLASRNGETERTGQEETEGEGGTETQAERTGQEEKEGRGQRLKGQDMRPPL